jgi:hypothetical protein
LLSRRLATSAGDLQDFPIAGLLDFWRDGEGGSDGSDAHAARLVQRVLQSWRTTVSRDLEAFPPATSDCLCLMRQRLCATRDAIEAMVREVDPLVDAAGSTRHAPREFCTT